MNFKRLKDKNNKHMNNQNNNSIKQILAINNKKIFNLMIKQIVINHLNPNKTNNSKTLIHPNKPSNYAYQTLSKNKTV